VLGNLFAQPLSMVPQKDCQERKIIKRKLKSKTNIAEKKQPVF